MWYKDERLINGGWSWGINWQEHLTCGLFSGEAESNTGCSDLGLAQLVERPKYFLPVIVCEVVLDDIQE